MSNSVAIGIDLGTGNSCVSTIEGGKPTVIVNAEGGRTTPSVVDLHGDSPIIGAAANRQRVMHPESTIFNIKRFMGNKYDQCEKIISKVPYKVINVSGNPRIMIENKNKSYSPEEISSFILAKMKKTAEDYLGTEIKDAVITCPAWFDNSAREATKLAGELCGLNVLRIINEPTAAILASDLANNMNTKESKIVLVADIGCGTTDFSVCEVSDGMVEVLASRGDVFLGGSDWDAEITNYIVSQFRQENGIDLSMDKLAMSRIIEASEKAKIELSTAPVSEINLPYISARDGQPLHLVMNLTRAKMEQITSELVKRVIECGKASLEAANITKSQLSCILLVGGQSRSLAIQEALGGEFGVTLNKSVNPDEAVSIGAAIQANTLAGNTGTNDILLLDVTPLTLGIETLGGVMTPLVEANTTIPCSKSQIFSTASDNQDAVTINVLQGERPLASQNKSIGVFNLTGIAPAKKGIPQIEVKFDIDASGIVTVSATDKATGKAQSIRIEHNNTTLSKEEIERIKNEAKQYEEEDKKTRENLQNANKCETLIMQTETSLENFKDNPALTEDDRTTIQKLLDGLKKMKETNNYDDFEKISQELLSKWNDISIRANQTNNNNNNNQN